MRVGVLGEPDVKGRKKMVTKFTEEKWEKVLLLKSKGLSQEKTAGELGIARSTLQNWCKKKKFKWGLGEGPRKIDEKKFLELYNQKMSDGEIGKILKVHRATIGNYRRSKELPAYYSFLGGVSATGEQIHRMKELHSKEHTIGEIAKETGFCYQYVRDILHEEGLDTSSSRGLRIMVNRRWDDMKKKVTKYLRENGPTPERVLSKELDLKQVVFSKLEIRTHYLLERFKFGGVGRSKYKSYQILNGLSVKHMGAIWAIKNDPRIIDFVAQYIPLKIESGWEASALVQHIKKQLGTERARKVVEKLGHQYSVKPKGVSGKGHPRRFTDREFLAFYRLKLNDTQIAKILDVTSGAIWQRRNKLELPPISRKRRRRR